jgi:hypothetical protein
LRRTSRTPKKAPPVRTKRELKWPAKFIEALAKTCNVARAARLAKVGRRTVYDRRAANPEFAAQWDESIKIGGEALEFEARRRAIEGVKEPRYYKGKVCGHVKRYSDLLLIVLLNAHFPEKYRSNHKLEHTGEVSLADLVGEAEARAEARKRERDAE